MSTRFPARGDLNRLSVGMLVLGSETLVRLKTYFFLLCNVDPNLY